MLNTLDALGAAAFPEHRFMTAILARDIGISLRSSGGKFLPGGFAAG